MREKEIQYAKSGDAPAGLRIKRGLTRVSGYISAIGTYRDDTKVHKALLNRVSELAITKAMGTNYTGEPQSLLNTGIFAPVKNMVKHVRIAGVDLTIDPSLPTFENDPFIAEMTNRA
ncbi:MAG TPA: hypothetical protein VNW06_00085, partial [Cytophagaceae bacterium]|nr:hypothetical protein [Cytophagaceae bacterium]